MEPRFARAYLAPDNGQNMPRTQQSRLDSINLTAILIVPLTIEMVLNESSKNFQWLLALERWKVPLEN